MCGKHPKPDRKVPSKVILIDLTDDWGANLLQAVGELLISSAQLEYQVYIVAKRKDGQGLLKWMLDHPDQIFGRYCCWLEQKCANDKKLLVLIARARDLWEKRNGYVHAIWGRKGGRRVRWRNFEHAGLSVREIQRLVKAVRKVRDQLEALTA